MDFIPILRRTPKGGGGSGGHGSSSSHGGSSSSSSGSSSSSSSSSSKGGSSSSSSSYKGGTTVVYAGSGGSSGSGGGGGGGGSHLPWWAILIIVLGTIFLVLFVIALIHYFLKERKRKSQGKNFRPGHAVWKAFCVASGLWFPIWLLKLLKGKKREKSAGSYTKIEEGHSTNNTAWHGAAGTPADTLYSQGGTGFKQTSGGDEPRYEPMSYSGAAVTPRSVPEGGASSSREQPTITGPIQQTSSIPLPTPSPSPAPSMVSAMTAPPPYSGGPATGADIYKPPPAQPTYVQAPPPIASQYAQVDSQPGVNTGLSTYIPATHPPHSGPGGH